MSPKKQTSAPPVTKPSGVSLLDEQLCFALYSNSQAIIKKYQPYLKGMNLTYPQYLVYLALETKSETTVNALGKDLGLDSGTLSPLLKRMEANGYVNRNRAAEDERRVMVNLTPAARALSEDIIEMQQAVACSTGLDTNEFRTLLAQLHSLGKKMAETD
ncbi:MarR family winged helix-turn-helix transcriptional regulator [Kiloniella antarctica]|uniref:MarR family winged helix-turn-helix transcriptional regulator n=1 Tax=Kiloniella antarctica TaxID=1550907 RepID=A0ABW5BMJ6_9PROT